MKGKIIITGGCGFIGSHTTVALLENGYNTVIIDNLSNSQAFILDRIQQITNKSPQFEQVDLANEEAAKAVYAKHADADAIIHFAAYKAVGESVQKPLMYYKNNLDSLMNTIQGQLENDIKHIIFSSSATVYGEPSQLPVSEKSEVQQPFSPYGNTKKIAEEILKDVMAAHANLSAISLRYFNPIGAHDSALIGELPVGVPNNLMPYITKCAIGELKQLQVFGDDYDTKDGTAVRDYLHVVDLANAHVLAVEHLMSGKNQTNYDCFNLGTGNGFTVLEIIESFERVSGLKLNYRIADRRAGDVPMLFTTNQKAKEVLGWQTKYSLDDMVGSAWAWEQSLRK